MGPSGTCVEVEAWCVRAVRSERAVCVCCSVALCCVLAAVRHAHAIIAAGKHLLLSARDVDRLLRGVASSSTRVAAARHHRLLEIIRIYRQLLAAHRRQLRGVVLNRSGRSVLLCGSERAGTAGVGGGTLK